MTRASEFLKDYSPLREKINLLKKDIKRHPKIDMIGACYSEKEVKIIVYLKNKNSIEKVMSKEYVEKLPLDELKKEIYSLV